MGVYYPESKVELGGFTARHYDTIMHVMTFGVYSSLARKAVRLMRIGRADRIIDLGAGTGRNACLMMEYLSSEGGLVGLDISREMIGQFEKTCAGMPNARIVDQRIDMTLPCEDEFDKAFISFVLHGFPQEARKQIIRNVFKALRKQGEFFILDYNEFSMENMPLYLKIPFKIIECPYAFDFMKRDWQKILGEEGFGRFEEYLFLGGYVRLLKAVKA